MVTPIAARTRVKYTPRRKRQREWKREKEDKSSPGRAERKATWKCFAFDLGPIPSHAKDAMAAKMEHTRLSVTAAGDGLQMESLAHSRMVKLSAW